LDRHSCEGLCGYLARGAIVGNAIFAAVGVRLRDLPIRPAAVLEALTSKRQGH
ncbi:MAG: hypothetical protein QOH39_2243, partial [Verrucomicrobiota bacterium]